MRFELSDSLGCICDFGFRFSGAFDWGALDANRLDFLGPGEPCGDGEPWGAGGPWWMGGQRALDALGLGGTFGHDSVDRAALDPRRLDLGPLVSGRRPTRGRFEVQAGGAVGRGGLLVIGDRLDEFLDVSCW